MKTIIESSVLTVLVKGLHYLAFFAFLKESFTSRFKIWDMDIYSDDKKIIMNTFIL